MFCQKCGKENEPGSQFCKFCGAALQNPVPAGQPSGQWKPIDPNIQKIIEENRENFRRKKLLRTMNTSRIVWLVTGILHGLVGILGVIYTVFLVYNGYTPGTVGFWVWSFPRNCVSFFAALSALAACLLGIFMFVRRKDKSLITFRRRYSVWITLFLSEALTFLNFYTFYILARYGHFLNSGVAIVISYLFILSAVSAFAAILTDMITTSVISKKGTPSTGITEKSAPKSIRCFTLLLCTFAFFSAGSQIASKIIDTHYNHEKWRVIRLVKNGVLAQYPDKTIGNIYDEIDENDGYGIAWFLSDNDPRNFKAIYSDYKNKTRYITGRLFRHCTDNVTEVTFCLSPEDQSVTVDHITYNDRKLTAAEVEQWIKLHFSGELEYTRKQAKAYLKNGRYVSESRHLYSAPTFNSRTTYSFPTSGFKDVLDYQIGEDRTLWLKFSGSTDGKYDAFWYPCPN